ncbi:MAG: replication-relaxation family protein [Pseudomonadota bacterium]
MSAGNDALGRRSRLRPQATGKRIALQERDWLWLRKLHEHGPLASSFLLAFAKHVGASEKRAKERLTDLFHEANTAHGGPYLARPPQQFATIDSRYNQLVYDLAPAGVRALKERALWHETNAARSGPWLHNFMAGSITASIEIGALERADLAYIPEHRILERAKTTLSYPVTIIDPITGKRLTKELKPDALFGLEYKTEQGSRYRFFAVEADRGTEPVTAGTLDRKSALRSLLQYREYVAGGIYKKHLKLSAPLLVLTVCGDEGRMDALLRLAAKIFPEGNPYLLYQCWKAFGVPWRTPMPNSNIVTKTHFRPARSDLFINGNP